MHAAGSAAAGTAQRAGAVASDVATDAARGAGGFMRWLPWLIAAAVALFLLSRLSSCGQQPADKAVVAPPAPPPAAVTAPPPAAPAVVATDLPTKVYFGSRTGCARRRCEEGDRRCRRCHQEGQRQSGHHRLYRQDRRPGRQRNTREKPRGGGARCTDRCRRTGGEHHR